MPPTDPPQGENSPKASGKTKAKSKRKEPPADVVGIEIGAGLPEGAPAVRLLRSPEGFLRIAAAGFVPVVSDVASILAMPADMRGPWSLPAAFRAPAAALAVTSPDALVRQSDSAEDATAVPFRIAPPEVADLVGEAFVDPHPFLPDDPARRDALCAEMEGASIGHVCYQNGVTFCVIRAISDNADGEADMDFPSFAKKASHISTQLVLKYLED